MSDSANGPGPVRPQPPGRGTQVLFFGALLLLAAFAFGTTRFPSRAVATAALLEDHAPTIRDAQAAISSGDIKHGREILLALAKKGNAEAEYQLGLAHEIGSPTGAPEIRQAVTWYEKAAAHGVMHAKARLGHIYLKGVGVTQDFAKARGLLQEAAEAGNARAQFDLARMWERGWGGPKNLPMAYAWFELGAQQDYRPAVTARNHLLSTMDPQQVAKGQTLLAKLSQGNFQPEVSLNRSESKPGNADAKAGKTGS